MYVAIDKKTKKVLHIDYRDAFERIRGEDFYGMFNPKTMESCWTDRSYVPVHFTVNEMGKLVDLTLEEKVNSGIQSLAPTEKLVEGKIIRKTRAELLNQGIVSLTEIKQQRLQHYSKLSIEMRRKILPDYKLENAALGVYDETTTKAIIETVRAFRKEFYRLKKAVENCKNTDQLDLIEPKFPAQLAE